MTSLPDIKKQARLAAATIRKAAHQASADTAPLALAGQEFPVQSSKTCNIVSAFFPYQSEMDTRPLLGRLAGEGWTTALPIVIALGQPLLFRRWFPGEPTILGKWDIPRPSEEAPLVEPDVLLVPLLAFDYQGFRLGYGGGFYDRTLAQYRAARTVVAIGVGYAAQQVAEVPHDALDQPLDFIMTEQEVIKCG